MTDLRAAGAARGDLVGLTIGASGAGIAYAGRSWLLPADADLTAVDSELRPRWVVWSGSTAMTLCARGVRVATCWDIAAAHRLLFGRWRADPGWVWAHLRGLPLEELLSADLFGMSADGDPLDPVGPDGYLRPEWGSGDWADHPAQWAELALSVAGLQQAALSQLTERPMALATARSESAAELLCAE